MSNQEVEMDTINNSSKKCKRKTRHCGSNNSSSSSNNNNNGRAGNRGHPGGVPRSRPAPQPVYRTTPVSKAIDQLFCQEGYICGLEEVKKQYHTEREGFCHTIHARKVHAKELVDLATLKETEFEGITKTINEKISQLENQVAFLKGDLPLTVLSENIQEGTSRLTLISNSSTNNSNSVNNNSSSSVNNNNSSSAQNGGNPGSVPQSGPAHQPVHRITPVTKAIDQLYCRNGHIYGLGEVKLQYSIEREGFCHNVHSRKVRIKELQDQFRLRQTEFEGIVINRSEKISKLETEIAVLKGDLPLKKNQPADQCDSDLPEVLSENIQEGTSSQAHEMVDQSASMQNEVPSQAILLATIKQLEEMMKRKDTDIQDLRQENQSLTSMLEESSNDLQNVLTLTQENDRLCQKLLETEVSCKDSIKALQETFEGDLAETNRSWECKMMKLEREFKTKEDEALQKDSTILTVTQEKRYLAQKLLETEVSCKEHIKALQETFSSKLSETNQSWGCKSMELEREIQKLDNVTLQKDSTILQLHNDIELLSHINGEFQNKLQSLEEDRERDLIQVNGSWESRMAAMEQQMQSMKERCEDELTRVTNIWESKVKAMDAQVNEMQENTNLMKDQLKRQQTEIETSNATQRERWMDSKREMEEDRQDLVELYVEMKRKGALLSRFRTFTPAETEAAQRKVNIKLQLKKAKRRLENGGRDTDVEEAGSSST